MKLIHESSPSLLLSLSPSPPASLPLSLALSIALSIAHSLSPPNQKAHKIARSGAGERWRKCKALIIDEISMVSGETMDQLEKVATKPYIAQTLDAEASLLLRYSRA